MIYPTKIPKNACVGIVSLSSGVLGEKSVQHEVELVEKRLPQEFGLKFKYMGNALKGEKYLAAHPEQKAADLKQAFLDSEVDLIWSALGGDDTFRTLPYLLNDDFRQIVQDHPKPFLGFSDTTNNHLMLYKLGLATYYAPALLSDVAELGPKIPPFTKTWLKKLFSAESNIVIESSPVWYEARKSFGPEELDTPLMEHPETHGHEYLYGQGVIEGKLLGGCLDSLYEMLAGGRYDDQLSTYQKYPIFPSREEWQDKIIFLETSEELPPPEKLRKMLEMLEETGLFEVAAGLVIGKPHDEVYYDEYREIYQELAQRYRLPTVYNLNFGHSAPRIVLPYDRRLRIDFAQQQISLPDDLIGDIR